MDGDQATSHATLNTGEQATTGSSRDAYQMSSVGLTTEVAPKSGIIWMTLVPPHRTDQSVHRLSKNAMNILRHTDYKDENQAQTWQEFKKQWLKSSQKELFRHKRQHPTDYEIIHITSQGDIKGRYQVGWNLRDAESDPEWTADMHRCGIMFEQKHLKRTSPSPAFIRIIQGQSKGPKINYDDPAHRTVVTTEVGHLEHGAKYSFVNSIQEDGILVGMKRRQQTYCTYTCGRYPNCTYSDELVNRHVKLLLYYVDSRVMVVIDVQLSRRLGTRWYQTPALAFATPNNIDRKCVVMIYWKSTGQPIHKRPACVLLPK